MANAYRDAQKIKGEGDAQAAAVYAEAFGRDPQFAQFYRSLDAYKQSFNKKSDVLVIDPSASDFFRVDARLGRRAPRAAAAPSRARARVDSDVFWSALALVLVIEGLLPFLSPGSWRRGFSQLHAAARRPAALLRPVQHRAGPGAALAAAR